MFTEEEKSFFMRLYKPKYSFEEFKEFLNVALKDDEYLKTKMASKEAIEYVIKYNRSK